MGFDPQVINTGGGFGIRYTEDDKPLPATEFVEAIIDTITEKTTSWDGNASHLDRTRTSNCWPGYNSTQLVPRKMCPVFDTYPLMADG